jgi:hypothetical protein
MKPVKTPIKRLELYDCWASSRLDRLWRYEWWCTNGGTDPHIHRKEGRDFGGYVYL